MIKQNNKYFCIVGIGNHSYSKLIPALLKSGKKIVGLVSRSQNSNIRRFQRFSNINVALKKLPKKTVFLISTPPSTHITYIKILLKNKRNLIVEKPMFTHPKQVLECKKYFFQNNKLIFKEAFMYKYSLLYKKIKSFINNNVDDIRSISCNFLIPNNPVGTFRDNVGLENSPLFDFGCYVIDFFVSLKKTLYDFRVLNIKELNGKIIFIKFSFIMNGIRVSSKIGIEKDYCNEISFTTKKGPKIEFSPIFYGRSKHFIIKNEINNTNIHLYDNNAFVKMFKESNKIKKANYYNTQKVNQILFEFSKEIEKIIYDNKIA